MDTESEPQLPGAYEVVIVDDHPLFRAALKSAVCAACSAAAFYEADSVASLLDTLDRHPGVDLRAPQARIVPPPRTPTGRWRRDWSTRRKPTGSTRSP